MRESFETSSNQFLPRQNEIYFKPLDEFVDSLVFFARVLSPPTQALVDLLRNDPGLPGNGSWILFYPEDPELLKKLQQEHTQLFVSAYPELNPSPFASSTSTSSIRNRLCRRSKPCSNQGLEL